ncbi:MAG: 4Fe-4S dicluster domain-containing protein [Planctomycetia bacterium]
MPFSPLPLLPPETGGCGTACGGCGTKAVDPGASRRDFLRDATTMTLGAMSLTLLSGAGPANAPHAAAPGGAAGPGKPVWGFLVDTTKCTGAGKCLTACRVENAVPEGQTRTWVERYVHYKDGRVEVDLVPETGYADSAEKQPDPDDILRAYFVPKLCNQCVDAPCNQVCPVHASIKSPEGIELVDADRCIGCGYCVQACPYGIRFMNHDTGVADKCDWCYHRIMRDEQPACVEACPTGARVFGRIDDPDSEIAKRLATLPTSVLKQHLGTIPLTRYVGITDEVT